MKTACGTPGYVAPEVIKNRGYAGGSCDMWSAGVILYILLCGFPPFYEDELPALFDQILKGRYDFPSPWWDNISPDAKDLVRKMLTVDAKKRITAKEVLSHKWIVGKGSDNELKGAQADLKKHQATRKMKKAMRGVLAAQKMKLALAAK